MLQFRDFRFGWSDSIDFGELHNMCVSKAGTNESFAMSNVVEGGKLFEL